MSPLPQMKYLRSGPDFDDLELVRSADLPRGIDLADAISELRKRSPGAHVLAWYDGVASDELFISVLTIGEIRQGIERLRRKDADQAERLQDWLSGLLVTYSDHLVASIAWPTRSGGRAGGFRGHHRR